MTAHVDEAAEKKKKKSGGQMCSGKKNTKTSLLLNIGHKSSGWDMPLYSLPFAVPTHSCVTAESK